MTWTSIAKRLLSLAFALSLATGLWQTSAGLWIYAKAGLAQLLLQRAWIRAVTGEQDPKPWPWADTWPVARLKNERLGVDLIVLADAGGHALAFGPAHVTGTAPPGTHGTTVITGHRDTHFAFLRKLRPGDFLSIDTPDGRTSGYVVRDTAVIDRRTGAIASDGIHRLALITCYPFEAIRPGGPWRFVVMAEGGTFGRNGH
jgi:sortase A